MLGVLTLLINNVPSEKQYSTEAPNISSPPFQAKFLSNETLIAMELWYGTKSNYASVVVTLVPAVSHVILCDHYGWVHTA